MTRIKYNSISVILPAHNEENNISKMIRGLLKLYDEYINEIIIVNDCSTDRTQYVVKDLINNFSKKIKLINRKLPAGVGRALKEGFKNIDNRSSFVLMMDSDFLPNLFEIEEFINKIGQGYDGVLGSRYMEKNRLLGYPLIKKILNRAFHYLANIFLNTNCCDFTNNYKLYKKEIVDSIKWESDNFAINAETGLYPILCGYNIAECSVIWIQRSASMGMPNFKAIAVGPDYIKVLLKAIKVRFSDKMFLIKK